MTTPRTADERTILTRSLTRHREAVLWKLDGLTEADLRRSIVPSGTSLIGLVKHMAAVEYGWFCEAFGREVEPFTFDVDADPDSDMHAAPGETAEDIIAFYQRAVAAADASVAAHDLDAIGLSWRGDEVSMRWVIVHMIEEVARHAGHMDILRELIDGSTGDHKPPA